MKENSMPVGEPIYFEGDILKIDPNAYGFFEVDVESPCAFTDSFIERYFNIPFLQCKVKTPHGGLRTVSPVGTWSGVYLSDEIKKALTLGYKFKIKRGYLFDKDYIFTEYVEFLYNLKVNSKKNSPDYIISKLLMNSLYGKLGMNPEMEQHIITSTENELQIFEKYIVSNVLDLYNGKELISFFDDYSNRDGNRPLKISVIRCCNSLC